MNNYDTFMLKQEQLSASARFSQGNLIYQNLVNTIEQKHKELDELTKLRSKLKDILDKSLPRYINMPPPFQGPDELMFDWQQYIIVIKSINLEDPALQGKHLKKALDILGFPDSLKLWTLGLGRQILIDDNTSIAELDIKNLNRIVIMTNQNS